jgi:DNA repair protein RadD
VPVSVWLVIGLKSIILAGRPSAQISQVPRLYSRQWASDFCELVGLPIELGEMRRKPPLSDEDVDPAEPLPPLHGFQVQVYGKLRRLLNNGLGKAAMLSLPTGAGKTRVAVEAICDHLAQKDVPQPKRNLVLWIAQRNELQEQAWECFRQVWEVPPQRRGKSIRRTFSIRLVRAWGSRDPDEIQIGRDPAVLIASIDQLASWTRHRPEFFENFPRSRLLCAVVDEAHSIITREHARVLAKLGSRAKERWQVLTDSAPVIGLTATPWRSRDREARTLQQFLQTRLLHPNSLGGKPVSSLQRKGILAHVKYRQLVVRDSTPMSTDQLRRFKRFEEIPADYLTQLGYDGRRNAKIVKALANLPKRSRVLVFACSIPHAEILTMALSRKCGPGSAALITGKTPRVERAALVERFRNGDGLRFLCNVSVFTVGFDAPKVNVICVTRPTTSALLSEQMVGRGLRGPKNGGTPHCLVLDVQDKGLPEEIQSYARVLDAWEGRAAGYRRGRFAGSGPR